MANIYEGNVKPFPKQHIKEQITATLFPDHERSNFATQLFGPNVKWQGEFSIFDIHDQISGLSHSGYWNSYKLSNGGLYMAPEKDEVLHIAWGEYEFGEVMSSDASGIVATLLTLKFMQHEFSSPHVQAMIQKLEEFAGDHAEGQKILRIFD